MNTRRSYYCSITTVSYLGVEIEALVRHEDHVAAETVEPVDEGHQPLLEVEGLQLLPEPVQLTVQYMI